MFGKGIRQDDNLKIQDRKSMNISHRLPIPKGRRCFILSRWCQQLFLPLYAETNKTYNTWEKSRSLHYGFWL